MAKKNQKAAETSGKKHKNYKVKYSLAHHADVTNKYSASITNPTVQPDGKTETGVPIPDEENVKYSKSYGETNKL